MTHQAKLVALLREQIGLFGYEGDTVERFALIEKNVGGSGVSELPYYVTTHASLSAVSDYLAREEYPGDWEFEALVDLDEGTNYQIANVITIFEPLPTAVPPAPKPLFTYGPRRPA